MPRWVWKLRWVWIKNQVGDRNSGWVSVFCSASLEMLNYENSIHWSEKCNIRIVSEHPISPLQLVGDLCFSTYVLLFFDLWFQICTFLTSHKLTLFKVNVGTVSISASEHWRFHASILKSNYVKSGWFFREGWYRLETDGQIFGELPQQTKTRAHGISL